MTESDFFNNHYYVKPILASAATFVVNVIISVIGYYVIKKYERTSKKNDVEQALGTIKRDQEILAEVAAGMIETSVEMNEAGTNLQREARYNVQAQGEARQTNVVSTAGQEAAAHARETVTVC